MAHTQNTSIPAARCIHTTTDYGMFKHVKGNRKVNMASPATRKLLPSIVATNGNIMPILVDKNMTIIDGQHRVEICKQAKVPVSYIIAPDKYLNTMRNADLMTTLNETNNGWKLLDYMGKEAYANDQKQYKYLLEVEAVNKDVGILAIITLAGLSQAVVSKGKPIFPHKSLKKRIKRTRAITNNYYESTNTSLRSLICSRAQKKVASIHPSIDFDLVITGIRNHITDGVPDSVVDVANMMITAYNSEVNKSKQLTTILKKNAIAKNKLNQSV